MLNYKNIILCKVCSSSLNKIKYIKSELSEKNIGLYHCKECGSFFSNIENTNDPLNEFANSNIDVYMNENYVKKRVQDIFLYSKKKNWLPNININFLDIGCGVGWSLLVADENNCRSYGVEPVKAASEFANNNLKVNVINSLFKSSLFKELKFDFIMMDQVLEHVPNPREFIKDAFTLLKPGGLFFLACPPLDWSRLLISASYQLPRGIIEYIDRNTYLSKMVFKFDTFCFPEGHINYFSTKAISILANFSGAEVLEQYHFNKNRPKYFPFFKLSTGSFFLKKK